MELLIPGLILVALMVYASTKIKRSAAKAFEAEHVDTDGFSIFKPDGLMNPVDPRAPFAFEAYSKDFGAKPFENVRQITADVRVFEDADLDAELNEIRRSVASIVSENAEDSAFLIRAVEDLDGAEMSAFYKLVPKDGKVFRLRIAALGEPSGDNQCKIDEMLESFSVK